MRIPGVSDVAYGGGVADVAAAPVSVVPLAGELARRELTPSDFTVIRPSLEDAVVSLLNGGAK